LQEVIGNTIERMIATEKRVMVPQKSSLKMTELSISCLVVCLSICKNYYDLLELSPMHSIYHGKKIQN